MTMTSELPTTLPLHKAWWRAVSDLASLQATDCGCWGMTAPCQTCMPAATAVLEAEAALREAGEWE